MATTASCRSARRLTCTMRTRTWGCLPRTAPSPAAPPPSPLILGLNAWKPAHPSSAWMHTVFAAVVPLSFKRFNPSCVDMHTLMPFQCSCTNLQSHCCVGAPAAGPQGRVCVAASAGMPARGPPAWELQGKASCRKASSWASLAPKEARTAAAGSGHWRPAVAAPAHHVITLGSA